MNVVVMVSFVPDCMKESLWKPAAAKEGVSVNDSRPSCTAGCRDAACER